MYTVHYTVHCDTIKLHQIFTHQMCTSDAVVPSLGLPLNSRIGRIALLKYNVKSFCIVDVFKMFAVFTISLFISVSIIDK